MKFTADSPALRRPGSYEGSRAPEGLLPLRAVTGTARFSRWLLPLVLALVLLAAAILLLDEPDPPAPNLARPAIPHIGAPDTPRVKLPSVGTPHLDARRPRFPHVERPSVDRPSVNVGAPDVDADPPTIDLSWLWGAFSLLWSILVFLVFLPWWVLLALFLLGRWLLLLWRRRKEEEERQREAEAAQQDQAERSAA